jgi:hypothetical protein
MGVLTDIKIKTAAPRDKEYLLADGDGSTCVSAQARRGSTAIKMAVRASSSLLVVIRSYRQQVVT